MKAMGGGAGRPPGTATRLTTGMAGGPPGTGRPGSRGGAMAGGVALASSVQVTDRPMTQQGLGGMKTGARGPQRQVQDKTYFLGLLRGKINDLTSEIGRLQKEIETTSEEQSSYVSYEKRAEALASEISDLQGELGDYNTLVDKLTTDEDIADVEMDYNELKAQNDREAKGIEALFEQKQDKDMQIRQLETELEQEKRMADNLVADMPPDMRKKYMELKDFNEHLVKQIERGQQELDALNMKKADLEEELALSQVKQEAVRLYEQINELEEKKNQLEEESRLRGTPAEERERLLKQVKDDNQEIAGMERQTNEVREKANSLQDEIRQLDMDIEENQGERNQKYKELKKREETMNEFLDSFEETKTQEMERISQLEQNVVLILEHMSRFEYVEYLTAQCNLFIEDNPSQNLGRFQHLPTPEELASMKDDLVFKETEMKKSETTASGLASESEKLGQDLMKVEQLESKVTQELDMLRSKIDKMTQELEIYSDLEKLKEESEAKRQRLASDKINLQKRRDTFKKVMQHLSSQYEALKAQLNDNETYAQLGNLEKKWQHHEQNNFVMKEFIATKSMECDYRPISKHVSTMIANFNQQLQDKMSGKTSYA